MKTRHFLTVAEKIEILDYHEKYKEMAGNVAKLPEHCARFASKAPFSEDWFKTFVKIFGQDFAKT